MRPDRCPYCGNLDRPGSRYCGACGARYPSPNPSRFLGSRYLFRFQIDPLEPGPRRDIRWVMIVVGFAFVVLGILFLAVSAIVSGAVSAGAAGCLGSACPTVDPGPWFLWIGVPFLGVGALLMALGLWWTLR